MGYKKIMIGIPMTWNFMYGEYFVQFLKCQSNWSDTYSPRVYIRNEHMLDECRNNIVKEALNYGASHILFWDADVLPPENFLKVLMGHMDSGKMIAGLLCFQRHYPFYPLIFDENPKSRYLPRLRLNYEKGCVQAYSTGTGCLMVNTDVFRKLEYPWFKFEEDPDNPGEKISEDLYFCRKAKDAGHKIYVDTVHTCGHLTTGPVVERMYTNIKPHIMDMIGSSWVNKSKQVMKKPEKKIVYWGKGPDQKSDGDDVIWS